MWACFSRISGILFLLTVTLMLSPDRSLAERLTIVSPDTASELQIDLGPNDAGELIIYLKSFGDMVSGFLVTILDERSREVGRNISDMYGIAKFTNLPAGRFRIFVEKKFNDRGGMATVSIGDLKLNKVRKQ